MFTLDNLYTHPGHLIRRVHQIAVALFMAECGESGTQVGRSEEITDDQFWSEYLSMTIQDMSLKYGVSSLKVKTERKRRNLEMKSEYVSESFPEPTERQKEVFIGGLLGDGGVYPAAKGRAFYKESHSVNQDLYVKEVHRLLHPFSNPLSLYIEKRAGQNQLGFKTKSQLSKTLLNEVIKSF